MSDDIYYADTLQNSTGITINAQTVSLDNLSTQSGGSTLPPLGGLVTSNLTIQAPRPSRRWFQRDADGSI